MLAGGSGFGLSAADEVVRRLSEAGVGFDTGRRRLPLVPTAILFDLSFGDPEAQPSAEPVGEAIRSATDGLVACGSVGVGTGATVGKALGMERAMKGGFGFASLAVEDGPTVAAAVAVNAYGDVRDPDTGALVAGCRIAPDAPELAGADRVLGSLPPDAEHPWERNTTLAVVLTDAALDRAAARKVSEIAFGGLHRTILPACGLYDGDLVATLSLGSRPAHVHRVGVLAQRAVEHAVLTAVYEADGFGLLPTASDRSGEGL